jgi:hypothetical protein
MPEVRFAPICVQVVFDFLEFIAERSVIKMIEMLESQRWVLSIGGRMPICWWDLWLD